MVTLLAIVWVLIVTTSCIAPLYVSDSVKEASNG